MFTSLKQKLDAALNAEKIGNLATALVLFQDAGDFANTTASTLRQNIEGQFSTLLMLSQIVLMAVLLLAILVAFIVIVLIYDKRDIVSRAFSHIFRIMPKPKIPKAPRYVAFPKPAFKPPSFKAPS